MESNCSCNGDHSHDCEIGVQYTLYQKINRDDVECLNEREDGSGVMVFKPWEERLNRDKFVESDDDDELLFNIPFTGNVKLKGIIVVGGPDGSHPRHMKLFKNRPKMSFDEAATACDQEFELADDQIGVVEYPIKVVKFSSVHHLTIYFSGNAANDRTRIDYIGLKGEWSPAHRHGVTICTYESRPQISDHETNLMNNVSHDIH
ncbi:PITH domain-containing protein GA19395 isoform X2 [Venturia canescens]|nr:PITH domain-containing protein GA19395 isoform X2 [Venturia canescens]XP_043275283.1 PITH domain-containing protein GA19395 isoform X2 [Venturia canescens]